MFAPNIRFCSLWIAAAAGVTIQSFPAQNPFPSIVLSDPIPLIDPTDQSRPQSFAAQNGRLFFQQATSYGSELWTSDGTAAGTTLVRDIAQGPASSSPIPIEVSGAAPGVFFTATTFAGAVNDPTDSGRELWITDGTSGGTRLVRDVEVGPLPGAVGDVVWLNGRAYFIGRGRGLISRVYRTDGTTAGTEVFFDTAALPGRLRVQRMIGGPGRLWMLLRNDVTSAGQLWAADGTPTGTVMVADLPATAFETVSGARGLLGVSSNDVAYLSLNDAAHGSEPWVADLTGARLLKDLSPGTSGSAPREFVALSNGRVVISAGPQLSFQGGLFGSDGTEAGTSQIATVTALGNTFPVFVSTGPLAFLVTFAAQTGYEVWRTDGTAPGTFVLKDIVPGENGTILTLPVGLRTTGGFVFFLAGDGAIWKSDGTVNGTIPVPDSPALTPGTSASSAASNGIYYLTAPDAAARSSIWRTDGTGPGTFRILDPIVAPSGWLPDQALAMAGGLAFFVGSTNELWRTNGTPAGTFALGFEPGTASGAVELVPAGPVLYTTGFDEAGFRLNLVRSDGSIAGTRTVADLGDFAVNDARAFTWLGDRLFFSHTRDDETLWEPWLSDGTPTGTARLADLNPGIGGSFPRHAVRLGNSIFRRRRRHARDRTLATAAGRHGRPVRKFCRRCGRAG